MKQKLLYTMLCVTLSMVFLIGNYSKCSLGGTTQEHEILARVRSGEITIEEANNLMNALPDSQRSPDVVAAGNSSNTESSTPATTTKPEPQKAEPKCNHTYTSEVLSEPTCVEKGIRKYTCQSCGNTYTEEIALVDEHDYKEEITKEPTCDETGEKTFPHNTDKIVSTVTAVAPSLLTLLGSDRTQADYDAFCDAALPVINEMFEE